jgi:hypothetical protein
MQVEGEWKTEIVRDAAVIAAYVRKRRQLEEESTMANTLAPTGDAERDAWAKKRCVFPCRSLGDPFSAAEWPWLGVLGRRDSEPGLAPPVTSQELCSCLGVLIGSATLFFLRCAWRQGIFTD